MRFLRSYFLTPTLRFTRRLSAAGQGAVASLPRWEERPPVAGMAWFQACWRDRLRRGDIAWVVLMILGAVGGVSLFFDRPGWCALLMGVLLLATWWRWHSRLDVTMALCGALCGPVLEYWATAYSLWQYPHTSIGRLPAWVFTLWPVFPILLLRLTCALLPTSMAPRPWLDLTTGVLVLVLELLVLVQCGDAAPLWCAAITAAMILVVLVIHRSPHLLAMILISGIVGTACEALPVALGAWTYPQAVFMGMPAWLPTGYSLFGLAMVCLASGIHGLLPGVRERWQRAAAPT